MLVLVGAALASWVWTAAARPRDGILSVEKPEIPGSGGKKAPFGIVHLPSNTAGLDPGVAEAGDPFYPSRASTGGVAHTAEAFEGPEACAGCHPAIFEEWSASMMSLSWQDPVYRGLLRLASESLDGAIDNFCIGCHSPVGLVTGEANPAGTGMSAVAEAGVSCDVCHSISGVTGIGNGAYTLTPRMIDGEPLRFGPYSDAVSPAHHTTRSELHTRSEFCSSCHEVTHPTNRVPIERTYTEWRDSPYNAQGVTCQACHMTPAPGKASPLGKDRDEVFSHRFVGGNVSILAHFGKEEQVERSEALLRGAATLEWASEPDALSSGRTARIAVRVTNSGAGHKLPTGFPEGREVWLDLLVRDATGREVYRLGAVRDGQTEPGTRSFKVVLGDAMGQPVEVRAWEADRILSDTRLPALASVVETFDVPIPASARGPLTIQVDLNYWPFSPRFLDELGVRDVQARIVRMARLTQAVPLARR